MIRETFRTFCFADAETVFRDGNAVVDTGKPPGKDESAFVVALLTAVCRPSLHHAPGVLLRAAPMSGAGAGKGLLARCISLIAFGREPHAVTAGATAEELEKRIAAELIEGSPVLFLDNLNNTAFRSNLLASAITERPARVRVLGRSQMVPLNASALVILTGNGLSVSEDLARRFIVIELDPRMEAPEARSFANDIRAEVTKRRTELLSALLTIWRWGRLEAGMPTGRPLGSFEDWCRWVRDPLLVLGCKDPADRVSETKERDGRRQATAELFATWWDRHHDGPVAVRDLNEDLRHLVDPQGRGRQYVSAQLEKLAGTRIAGFVLTRQAPAGRWGAATYAMNRTGRQEDHRDHGGHPTNLAPRSSDAPYAPDGDRWHDDTDELASGSADSPMPPMPPMPSEPPAEPEQTAGRRPGTQLGSPHMSASTTLKAPKNAGIAVRLDGDDLVLTALAPPDTNLVDLLKRHKVDIIRWLRGSGGSAEDWQALFDERAAIIEFDGGLSRTEAEALAAEDVARLRLLAGAADHD